MNEHHPEKDGERMSNENDTTNEIKAAEERGARWALDACYAAIMRDWAPPISPAGDQRARDAVRICDESRARTRAPADRVSETCGECRWCHPSEVCMHPKAHAEHEIDGCALPPPSWCPRQGSEPDRAWCAADLPAESVREGRAVSRELALDSALRALLEVVEREAER